MKLNIAQHIYQKLTSDTAVKAYVSDKVFPIATIVETDFPFIVFERDSVSPEYTKGGMVTTTTASTVYILAETYSESIKIAEAVVSALDRKVAEYDAFKVKDAILSGASESYTNNTFVQQLNFTFITED